MNKELNDALVGKNIIFIIGDLCTGKTELANQIENIDEIIDDGNFLKFKSNLKELIEIRNKLINTIEDGKRYVVIITRIPPAEFSILENENIAWIYTHHTPKYDDPILKKQRLNFMQCRIKKEAWPYLLCFCKNKKLLFDQGTFQKHEVKN